MIRYITSGESHGKQLTVIIDGVPAGLSLKLSDINNDLVRRQSGFGRGMRSTSIEKDNVEIVSGVRWGQTIGSPITLVIKNVDWENNKTLMSDNPDAVDENTFLFKARPGHADLAGVLKFDRKDIRDILERASARETAARVAAGAVFKKFLAEFGIIVYSFTREIGGIKAGLKNAFNLNSVSHIERSLVRTPDPKAEKEMVALIEQVKKDGDSVGGVFTVVAKCIPAGLGSHTQWDLKLDAKIAQSLMSIQAVKGVEFGIGCEFAQRLGSKAHDEIFYSKPKGFHRLTNNAGGFEGGMTNGEDVVVSCTVKAIPSLKKPLRSVNISTKKAELAEAVRSDFCVVPSAGVVGESALSYELAKAVKEKFGGDSIKEMDRNFRSYLKQIKDY
ncbi:MAG: chorismate synthase [Elusimicrobia bacterium]|nr:chorismate synthase [Candidatus Liberimonas magnetica]